MKTGEIIKVGKATITIGERLGMGDICEIFQCSHSVPKPEHPKDGERHTWYDRLLEDDGDTIETPAVIRVVGQSGDSDLLANEAAVLSALYPPGTADEKFYRYLPRLLESFKVRDVFQANVMPFMEGYISLADILKAYPEGIDYRDLAWMLKRSLAGIGFVHSRKVIHGSLIPPHIMVHPTAHGAKIMDWSYSVRDKTHSVRAYSSEWKAYLAPEILQRRIPTPATDIYMLAKCCVAILGGKVETGEIPEAVPAEFRAFLDRCLREKPSDRPQDAWELHENLDGVLLKLVGEPKYRPFAMPGASPPDP